MWEFDSSQNNQCQELHQNATNGSWKQCSRLRASNQKNPHQWETSHDQTLNFQVNKFNI